MPFVPAAIALKAAIASGRGRQTIPVFKTNTRWLPKPGLPTGPRELPTGPREESRPDVRVWRFDDHSAMTTCAAACERLGEAEEPGHADAAKRGWETRRQRRAVKG